MLNERWCRVCGLEQATPPWGDDGRTPTFEICDWCGVEFGYEDATPRGVAAHRERWLRGGATWFRPEKRPPAWELSVQLARVAPGTTP
jgi:hypothetical protein